MLVVSTYLLKSFALSPSQPVRIRSSVIPVVTHMMTELKSVPPIAHHAPTLTANNPIAHQNNCSPKLFNGDGVISNEFLIARSRPTSLGDENTAKARCPAEAPWVFSL